MKNAMQLILGYSFVFMSPICGGPLVLALGAEFFGLLDHQDAVYLGIAVSAAWLVLWLCWFDGSETQRKL
jgi:hypothetical protein